MGFAHFDIDKACNEISTLFSAQWKNGFLPHIVYWDQSALNDYFPGPDIYDIQRSPHAPDHILTSGLTQPPLHAFVLELMLEITKNDQRVVNLVKKLFAPIFSFHQYLYENRDPYNEGLVYIHHNWESGTDNSPTWDVIFESIRHLVPDDDIISLRKDVQHIKRDQRPKNFDYNCYLYLLDIIKNSNYEDQKIFEKTPLAVQDPLFNALLIRSNEALIKLAHLAGENDKISQIDKWYVKSLEAIDKLYDPKEGVYFPFDLINKKMIRKLTNSCFAPIITSLPTQERILRIKKIMKREKFGGLQKENYLCPSYDCTAADFEFQRYWRGPVWINMNWLLIRGFHRHDEVDFAKQIARDSIELVEKNGFFEYFDPRREKKNGKNHGYGSDQFSWTAALLIDTIESGLSD